MALVVLNNSWNRTICTPYCPIKYLLMYLRACDCEFRIAIEFILTFYTNRFKLNQQAQREIFQQSIFSFVIYTVRNKILIKKLKISSSTKNTVINIFFLWRWWTVRIFAVILQFLQQGELFLSLQTLKGVSPKQLSTTIFRLQCWKFCKYP